MKICKFREMRDLNLSRCERYQFIILLIFFFFEISFLRVLAKITSQTFALWLHRYCCCKTFIFSYGRRVREIERYKEKYTRSQHTDKSRNGRKPEENIPDLWSRARVYSYTTRDHNKWPPSSSRRPSASSFLLAFSPIQVGRRLWY